MLTIEQMARTLEAAGVVSGRELSAARAEIQNGDEEFGSVQDFVKVLKNRKALTEFQAAELSGGSADRVVIGSYVLVDRIASGGMGVVFRAHHPMMDREVALKFMRPTMEYDDHLVRRFKREVQTASKLVHPRIVRTLNAGVQNGVPYLVMDYVAGPDLSRLVRIKGGLSIGKAIEFTRQIAEGLHYAHGQRVVHRDIKPSNVLYDPKTRSIKILDMGLASIAFPEDQEGLTKTGPTESGQMLGTADYLAPEQYADASSAGPAADLYSLGCTLHFLLKERPPFSGRDNSQKALAHCNEPIPDLAADGSQIPVEVQSVFERLMAKAPEDRYQSASQVLAALSELQSSGVVGESSASLDVSLGDLPYESWAESEVNQHASTIVLKRRSRTNHMLLGASLLILAIAGVGGWQWMANRQSSPTNGDDNHFFVMDPYAEFQCLEAPAIDQVQWPVELIPYIDPRRDTASGNDWVRTDSTLLSGYGRATLLGINHPVPDEYRLTIRVRRVSGDVPMYVGLPVAETHGYVMIDRKGTSAVGQNEDGRIEGIVSSIQLKVDESRVIRFEVTADALRVFIDEEEATGFVGDTSTLRLPDALVIGETCGIFLGANNWTNYLAQFEFQSIVVEPINDRSKSPLLTEARHGDEESP